MGDVFRYNLNEYEEFKEFLEKNIAYIFSKEKVDGLEDLKENIIQETNYTKRAISTLLNTFLKLKEDDYLFIKKDDEFALGKVLSKPILSDYGLVLNVNFKKLNKSQVTENIVDSFKGRRLQKIGYENIYKNTEDTFNNLKEDYNVNLNQPKNSIVLRGSDSLLIYEDDKDKNSDIEISYKKKKKKSEDNNSGKFELIFEMKEKTEDNFNKEKQNLELLPMIYTEEVKELSNYAEIYKNYINFGYNMSFLYLKMLRDFQLNFTTAYLNLFK